MLRYSGKLMMKLLSSKFSYITYLIRKGFFSLLPFCISPYKKEMEQRVRDCINAIPRFQEQLRIANRKIKHLNREVEIFQDMSREHESKKNIPYFYLDPSAPKFLFDAVYKALVKEFHPDKGPKYEETMKQINVLRDKIYKTRGW
jgi:hypothetical protein